MEPSQAFANGIARRLDIPASETFRIQHVGTVPDGTLKSYFVYCPHTATGHAWQLNTDPFAGRTPSARELESLFADGGRVRHASPSRVTRLPVQLDAMRYATVTEGRQVDDAVIYCGRCPDCGKVLVMTVQGQPTATNRS